MQSWFEFRMWFGAIIVYLLISKSILQNGFAFADRLNIAEVNGL